MWLCCRRTAKGSPSSPSRPPRWSCPWSPPKCPAAWTPFRSARLRLQLGAELEAPDRAHLTARVADLEAINRQLVAERDARATVADTAKSRVTELEDELSAARESLRRVIKAQNRAP
jgi:hypothetical protein